MKDLQPNILDDFEHQVNRLMNIYHDEPQFPRMEDYRISREDLDSYLFDYQAMLDSEGSARAQQTFYGFIIVIPLIVISAFPLESLPWASNTISLLVGLLAGCGVAALVKTVRVAMKRMGLGRLRKDNPAMAAYVDAVLKFES